MYIHGFKLKCSGKKTQMIVDPKKGVFVWGIIVFITRPFHLRKKKSWKNKFLNRNVRKMTQSSEFERVI